MTDRELMQQALDEYRQALRERDGWVFRSFGKD
jgi:hypothetical protein